MSVPAHSGTSKNSSLDIMTDPHKVEIWPESTRPRLQTQGASSQWDGHSTLQKEGQSAAGQLCGPYAPIYAASCIIKTLENPRTLWKLHLGFQCLLCPLSVPRTRTWHPGQAGRSRRKGLRLKYWEAHTRPSSQCVFTSVSALSPPHQFRQRTTSRCPMRRTHIRLLLWVRPLQGLPVA